MAVCPKHVVVVCVNSTLTNVSMFARMFFFTTFTLWASYCTLFTVWLSILHVKHVASDWLLAGHTDETVQMPGLFQGIHDFLQRKKKKERK